MLDIEMIRLLTDFGSGIQTQLEAMNFPIGILRTISADGHTPDMLILCSRQRIGLRVQEVLCQLEGRSAGGSRVSAYLGYGHQR